MEDVDPARGGLLDRVMVWGPLLGWAAAILIVSAQPGDRLPSGGFWQADKLIHAAIYAVLGALAGRALHLGRSRGGSPSLAAAVIMALLLVGFGVFDEWTQRFTPGRDSNPADMLADALGSMTGFLAASRYYRRRHGPHPQLRR